MIKAVIFDLDGTLLDTIEDLADSMNIVLKKYGYPTHPVDSYKYFVGDGVREFASRALPSSLHSDEKLAVKIGTEAMEEYSKRWHNKTKPYEGVNELLENLARRKIKKAILSNKPHDFTLLTTTHFFGEKTFDEILGEKPTFRRKPAPDGAIDIMKKLNITPSETLYLGDTSTDMKTAVSAGIYPVGALWGFRSADELLKSGAKTLINSPVELLKLIQ